MRAEVNHTASIHLDMKFIDFTHESRIDAIISWVNPLMHNLDSRFEELQLCNIGRNHSLK
jgi:hypothetical protein